MSVNSSMQWFKQNFGTKIQQALHGSVLNLDFVTAIAFQETGDVWGVLKDSHSVQDVLRLCVGDTIDGPRRTAFPRNRQELINAPDGVRMFDLAHAYLGEMAQATSNQAYLLAAANPDKFVRAFGIFQYDLQHFPHDEDFFLNEDWKSIDACIAKLLVELNEAIASLRYDTKQTLTDMELCYVAIVYNTGMRHFNPAAGLKQGYYDKTHYYGEYIYTYLQDAKQIPNPSSTAVGAPTPPSGTTISQVAMTQYNLYHGVDEGDAPLRGQIANYYHDAGGNPKLDPTLDENAWSAAFVSYCVRESDAKVGNFKYAMMHSVYVQDAIQSADNNTGSFRAHPVTAYAPKIGDIIHHNRNGAHFDYDFARRHVDYPSHAAIVVDILSGNPNYAVTIGGNESNTVGKKQFPLTQDGYLDQTKIGPQLICVIENLTTKPSSETTTVGSPVLTVTARPNLNLRSGPGPEFPVIDKLDTGTEVHVIEYSNTASGRWALIDLKGDGHQDGYVFARYLG